jgi:hypothetical protein
MRECVDSVHGLDVVSGVVADAIGAVLDASSWPPSHHKFFAVDGEESR